MAQQVRLMGATYNDVPSVLLPDANNVLHAFTDTTPTTAGAADVASGKLFFDALGVLTTGTASGGGGTGREYETGTYNPTANTARPAISWANTHSAAPILVAMSDVDAASSSTANSNVLFVYFDPYKIFGAGFPYETASSRYAVAYYSYRGSSTSSSGGVLISHNSDSTTATGTSYTRYWASPTDFHPYSNSTSRYWRSGRTYKWIAIW